MVTEPDAAERNFVPSTPDVLAFAPVLDPTERYVLEFTAPTEPGEYTYVCTVPGHWRVMYGTLVVEA